MAEANLPPAHTPSFPPRRGSPRPGAVASLLQPCPAAWLLSYPVGTRDNSPRHDGPECLEPLGERSRDAEPRP